MESRNHAGLLQDAPCGELVVLRFQLAARTVDQDDRGPEYVGRISDLICHRPTIAYVVQDDLEVELIGQPEDSQNVVVPVSVEMNNALACQDVHQCLEAQITGRQFLCVVTCLFHIAAILDGLEKLLAYDRGGFRS